MFKLFVYKQTGKCDLSELLEGLPVLHTSNPSIALSYCYSPRQFSLIILELARSHPSTKDRSAKELLFFREINLLYRGTPLIIMAPQPELFLPDLKRFGFERIVDLDFMFHFLEQKQECHPCTSLDEYFTYAIGIPIPFDSSRVRRLIDCIIRDLEMIRSGASKSSTAVP